MGDSYSRAALVKFWLNGAEEILPNDWRLHISQSQLGLQVYVERDGETMPLDKALILRDALTTSSNASNRSAITIDSKRR